MEFWQNLNAQVANIGAMIVFLQTIIHILFAGAVARDSGQLTKRGIPTYLVSGVTWAFATLLGGVFIAAIYWFMHHLRQAQPKDFIQD